MGRSYESREIRLMLSYWQHMKDPTAIVINEHKHHSSIVFPLPEQSVLIMEEGQVPEHTNHWPVALRCNPKRCRDDAIDPASSTVAVYCLLYTSDAADE